MLWYGWFCESSSTITCGWTTFDLTMSININAIFNSQSRLLFSFFCWLCFIGPTDTPFQLRSSSAILLLHMILPSCPFSFNLSHIEKVQSIQNLLELIIIMLLIKKRERSYYYQRGGNYNYNYNEKTIL